MRARFELGLALGLAGGCDRFLGQGDGADGIVAETIGPKAKRRPRNRSSLIRWLAPAVTDRFPPFIPEKQRLVT